MRNFIMGLAFLVAVPGAAQALSVQENPHEDYTSTLSGITVISGWKCDPGVITFSVDDGDEITMASGTGRGDTAAVCGNDGNNGYGLLWNVNLFGDGQHTAEFFDDGVKFAEATFNVVTLGENFAAGVEREFELPNFPEPGQTAHMLWVEGLQNFVIDDFTPTPLVLPNLAPKRQRYFTGTVYDFCQSPLPSNTDLLVIVKNEGTGTAGASVLNVDFGAFGDVDVDVPGLAPGAEFETVVEFPPGCFNSDCDFTIMVDKDDDVTESNEADNDVATLCLG